MSITDTARIILRQAAIVMLVTAVFAAIFGACLAFVWLTAIVVGPGWLSLTIVPALCAVLWAIWKFLPPHKGGYAHTADFYTSSLTGAILACGMTYAIIDYSGHGEFWSTSIATAIIGMGGGLTVAWVKALITEPRDVANDTVTSDDELTI